MELTSKTNEGIKEERIRRNKMIMSFIVIMLIVLGILAFLIYMYIGKLKNDTFKLYVDRARSNKLVDGTDVIVEKGQVWLSVKKLSELFGYELYDRSDYFSNEVMEDCFYIQGPNEVVNFFYFDENREDYKSYETSEIENLKERSKKFQKIIINNGRNNSFSQRTDEDDKPQLFTLNYEINKVNNQYYLNSEDARVAFNIRIDYDKKTNALSLYSLDYLIKAYATQYPNSALEAADGFFCNKKALLYGYLITSSTTNDGVHYGVTSIETGNTIIPNNQKQVEFIEGDKEFLVTAPLLTGEKNSKVGIYSIEGKTIISPKYVEVTKIDSERNWYLVKDIGDDGVSRYGIIDRKGSIVVDIKYKKIGINRKDFSTQNIENPYILLDSVIPAVRYSQDKVDDDWVFINLNNQEISTENITKVGCTTSSNKNGGGALLFQEKGYNFIIVGRKYQQMSENSKGAKEIEAYTLINKNGELLEGDPVKAFYVNYNDRGIYFEALTQAQDDMINQGKSNMAIALLNDGLLYEKNSTNQMNEEANNQNSEENNEQSEE